MFLGKQMLFEVRSMGLSFDRCPAASLPHNIPSQSKVCLGSNSCHSRKWCSCGNNPWAYQFLVELLRNCLPFPTWPFWRPQIRHFSSLGPSKLLHRTLKMNIFMLKCSLYWLNYHCQHVELVQSHCMDQPSELLHSFLQINNRIHFLLNRFPKIII